MKKFWTARETNQIIRTSQQGDPSIKCGVLKSHSNKANNITLCNNKWENDRDCAYEK